ncbi:hypothetical protein ASF29_23595 [Rhizobium sp. Leaf262]|nr:hypothetical protein ASF29_23595 [Rhizobium sp. Leaf262]
MRNRCANQISLYDLPNLFFVVTVKNDYTLHFANFLAFSTSAHGLSFIRKKKGILGEPTSKT